MEYSKYSISFKTFKSLSYLEETIYPFPRVAGTIMQTRVENNNEVAWLQMAGVMFFSVVR